MNEKIEGIIKKKKKNYTYGTSQGLTWRALVQVGVAPLAS